MRKITMTAVATLILAGGVACSSDEKPAAESAAQPITAGPATTASGTFGPFTPGQLATAYDTKLVPAGASANVNVIRSAAASKVTFTVKGLLPKREYGAHVHTKPCGAKPVDAGPHYQNLADPVKPSVNPKFANPENEVWLDFTTDASGDATSTADVTWDFRKGEANSVIIHAEHSHSEPGKAGTAGPRAACLSVRL